MIVMIVLRHQIIIQVKMNVVYVMVVTLIKIVQVYVLVIVGRVIVAV